MAWAFSYLFKGNDRPVAKDWNDRFSDINNRLNFLEAFTTDWAKAIANATTNALAVINAQITPYAQKLARMASIGFLTATSTTSVSLTIGNVPQWIVPEGDARDLFTPTAFVIVQRISNPAVFGVVQTLSYDAGTGIYAGQVVSNSGDTAYYTDWTLAGSAGSTLAQMAMLQQAYVARDAVAANTAQVAANTATVARFNARFTVSTSGPSGGQDGDIWFKY